MTDDTSAGQDVLEVIGAFSCIGIVFGCFPPLGPGRALAMRVLQSGITKSKAIKGRDNEIRALRGALSCMRTPHPHGYVVVHGPENIGKATLVHAAVDGTRLAVQAYKDYTDEEIVKQVLDRVKSEVALFRIQDKHVERILWWHTAMFGAAPTVIIEADMEAIHTNVMIAARRLMDYNFRVIVSASNDIMAESTGANWDQYLLQVEPLTREGLEAIPKLAKLLQALKDAGLSDVVWGLYGGVPHLYMHLLHYWKLAKYALPLEDMVLKRLQQDIQGSIRFRNYLTSDHPLLKELYTKFHGQPLVPVSEWTRLGVKASLARVGLHTIIKDGSVMVTPSLDLAFVLHRNLQETPSIAELKAIVGAGQKDVVELK